MQLTAEQLTKVLNDPTPGESCISPGPHGMFLLYYKPNRELVLFCSTLSEIGIMTKLSMEEEKYIDVVLEDINMTVMVFPIEDFLTNMSEDEKKKAIENTIEKAEKALSSIGY